MTSTEDLLGELETRFAVDRAVYAPRAALGLVAVLRSWRQRKGTCKVALPGAVCHEVVLAVRAAGCEPIFCDVDVANGLVTESEWARARALGADVAVVVHLYGNPASVRPVRSIFSPSQCLVVDDAAQALGSRTQEGPCGAMGDVGLLSFGETKHICAGNAALLFRDSEFAQDVEVLLASLRPAPEEERSALKHSFRSQLELARARLRTEGEAAAVAFGGLLEGMEAVLNAPLVADVQGATLSALQDYAKTSQARAAKASLWSSCLQGTGLEPVGMAAGCVPWRYVCRLPGIDWSKQQELADAMRGAGMHVSNWYLPAHWLVGEDAGALPGVEKLSREVFQFWVDDVATPDSIARDAATVRQTISRLVNFTTGV